MPKYTHPRVFISYSHDSDDHCERVLALAKQLRLNGVDARLDQFETCPPHGWPLWCAHQILDANFVLLICTETYRKRFLGLEEFGKGKGVKWEGKVIHNALYYEELNTGFIPIVFSPDDVKHIPETVRETSWYTVSTISRSDSAYANLLNRITNDSLGLPPLDVPAPTQHFRQRDDTSILTEEVWTSSQQIIDKLDELRWKHEEHERKSRQRHRVQLRALSLGVALIVLCVIAGSYWNFQSQERLVTDPVILRAKLGEKIETSFQEKLATLKSNNAKPAEINELSRWRDQAVARLDESVRFIHTAADDLKAPLIREATRQLQERGVDSAMEYLDAALDGEMERHKELTRQFAETYLFKAGLSYARLDLNAAVNATEKAIDLDPAWWRSHNRRGQLALDLAQWTIAERSFEQADKLVHEEEDRATVLSNLASLLQLTNRLADAEPMRRRVLQVFEKSLDPDHPIVATSLNNLAELLRDTGRFAEAEPMYWRALNIDEKCFGPGHPNVARDLNNLAGLLQATGRLGEAEPMFRRALDIDEKTFGPDHPEVAAKLNNLAGLLYDTNRLAEAEPMFRRALVIDEKTFGPDHPDVARDLNNLAGLFRATSRIAEAEPMLQRALDIDEKCYGPEHPYVAIRLNHLAELLYTTKRFSEAEPMFRRALAIDESFYGPEHLEVATTLNNLAVLLQTTNNLTEAELLSRRHIDILLNFACTSGHEHPHLRAAFENYAGLLTAIGRSNDEIRDQLDAIAKPYGIDIPAQLQE